MSSTERIHKIKGVVQHYQWGGFDFLPRLLRVANEEQKPYAEYWLGDHPKCPSLIVESNIYLNDFIQQNPTEILGEPIASKYSSLPFLFKVLDVRQMLSIQVHPDKSSAEKGFDEEEQKGVPVDAPHRNFKDKNHKPELMVALSDFWLLHGFKCEEDLVNTLTAVPELTFLIKVFYDNGYAGLYQEVMSMPQEKVNEILSPLINRIVPLYKSNELNKNDEHFWAARAALTFCTDDCYDRGIFSIYFLNLVHLEKGQGVYQPAGMLHAYLEGQNVELMASSDNVLRAGLTDKHIDVEEVMKHVQFMGTTPAVLQLKDEKSHIYETPAQEFSLQRLQLDSTYGYETISPEMIFLLNGEISVFSEGGEFNLKSGEAAFAACGATVVLQPSTPAEVFRVYTP